uniref:Uncharacterized protein n=1 Tax=Triticum urartu TaxID=4572 RepID=A0A8R7NW28_TRIUA
MKPKGRGCKLPGRLGAWQVALEKAAVGTLVVAPQTQGRAAPRTAALWHGRLRRPLLWRWFSQLPPFSPRSASEALILWCCSIRNWLPDVCQCRTVVFTGLHPVCGSYWSHIPLFVVSKTIRHE